MKSIDRRRFLKGVLAGLGAWLLARGRPAVPSPPTVTSAPPSKERKPSHGLSPSLPRRVRRFATETPSVIGEVSTTVPPGRRASTASWREENSGEG